MQYKHSFLVVWPCFVYLFQSVQARVANHQDALAARSPVAVAGDFNFLGEAQSNAIEKRQQLCVNDAYLQALVNIELAVELCGQIIGLPAVTVVVDSTPVITTTKAITTRFNTVTRIVRNTNTVVATITTSPTAALQKRVAVPDAEPALAPSEARDAALQLLAGTTAEPSITESFRSACTCRNIPATVSSTIIYTELPEIKTVTAALLLQETVNVTRFATLTSTTVVQASNPSSTLSPAETVSLPSPTAPLPSAIPGSPISDVISCPESDNKTVNVLLGSVRFDYFVRCNAAIQDESDLIRLPINDVTDCGAACARANEEFSDTICRGFTFDTSEDVAEPCILKRSATALIETADGISLLLTAVAASNNQTSYNRMYNPADSPSETEPDPAAVSSMFSSTSISFVTAPPVMQENSTASAADGASASSLSQGAGFSWSVSSSWYFYYAASWFTLFEATIISSESGSAQTAFSAGGSSGGGAGGGVNGTATVSASATTITDAPQVIFSPVTTVFGSSSSMNMSTDESTTIFNGDEITVISGSATTIFRAESVSGGSSGFTSGGASAGMNWTAESGSAGSIVTAASDDASGSVTILPFTNATLVVNSTVFSTAFSTAISMSGGGSTGGAGSIPVNSTSLEPTDTEAPRDGTASTEGTMDDNPRTGLQSMSEPTDTANGTTLVPSNATSTTGTVVSTDATNMTSPLSGTDGPRTGMQTLPTETSSTFDGSMNITSLMPTAMPSSSLMPSDGLNSTTSCQCLTDVGAVTVTRTISVVDCRAAECFPFYQAFADWQYSSDHDSSDSWDDGLMA